MVKELDITEYCRNNAIMSKLKAALEQIEVGNGYAVLDGLQTGSVTVTLVNDGETVHFESIPRTAPTTAIPPPEALKDLIAHAKVVGVPEVPMPNAYSPTSEPETADKPRRKKHSEDTQP